MLDFGVHIPGYVNLRLGRILVSYNNPLTFVNKRNTGISKRMHVSQTCSFDVGRLQLVGWNSSKPLNSRRKHSNRSKQMHMLMGSHPDSWRSQDDDDTLLPVSDGWKTNHSILHCGDEGTHPDWMVCSMCRGHGRISKPPTRKARLRQKRTRYSNKADHGSNNDCSHHLHKTTATSIPPRIDVCSTCHGSGLVDRLETSCLHLPAGFVPRNNVQADFSNTTQHNQHAMLPRIAIIGGGLSGLALAAACRHRGLPCIVYERDMHFWQRQQGYGLTLQQASRILQALGLRPGLEPDGITSTQHIVHTTDGTIVGQWGMRHWKKTEPVIKDGIDKPDITDKGIDDTRDADSNSIHLKDSGDSPSRLALGMNNSIAAEPVDNLPEQTKNSNNKRQNVHIARQALRYKLLQAATNGNPETSIPVHWNHRLLRVEWSLNQESNPDTDQSTSAPQPEQIKQIPDRDYGSVKLVFQVDQEVVHQYADLVVGADGIRSIIRQHLIGEDVTPLRYLDCIVILGICSLQGLITDPSTIRSASWQKHCYLLDGATVFQTADGITRIYMMPYSQSECMWQLSFPITEEDAIAMSQAGPSALRDEAIRRCQSWHSPVSEILQATPLECISGYPVYDRTLVTAELLEQRQQALGTDLAKHMTFMGDAAHPMSPFKGQGANQALLDALALARCIYEQFDASESRIESSNTGEGSNESHRLPSPEDIQHRLGMALQNYHTDMLSRSAVKVRASADAAQFLHTRVAIAHGNVTRGGAAAAAAAADSSFVMTGTRWEDFPCKDKSTG